MPLTEKQQRCVDTLDRPLVVAAGAGSGKTFTLTQRIVHALEAGFIDDIGDVCAITFTKKAAGELKARIKGELRARGLVEQALKVDESWISTIHGMCARILRAHALELGIDPAFKVAEGAVVDGYLAQAVDFVLAESDGVATPELDALFGEYPARSFGGRGTSIEGMLTDLVRAASSSPDGVDSLMMPGITLDGRLAAEHIAASLEELLALAADEKPGQKHDEWMAATEARLVALREALASPDAGAGELLSAIASLKLAKSFGGADYKARVDDARAVVGANVMEIRLGKANGLLETLVGLAAGALGEYERLKRAEGVLDNDDLLVLAARAIEERPSIAQRYCGKFKLIMVDEFQDTDQMQVDMIKRLAGEGAGRLCTVGDAQQSIYRFRGADVSVYRRHLASVRDGWGDGSIIELSQNFRSHPDVLAFVDRVFEKPDMFGGEFMSLSAGRDEAWVKRPLAAGRRRVVVQHTSIPWSGVPADKACELAARRIARSFAEFAEAGHSPGDMVVLLGRMTRADVYAQALRDAGLPCVISGGSVFSRSLEAAVVRELVRVIANPHETKPLFNVLVGPMFGVTAGDLLQIGGVEAFWKAAADAHDGRDETPPTLSCAFSVLGRVRDAAADEPVSRVVERAVADSGWLSRLERGGAEGLAAAGNVFKAIRMLRGVEQSGVYGPVSVMRKFEATLDSAKEAPGALSVSGGDSVRIMTVHASKGLEFPIVAVAEFKDLRSSSSRLAMASVGRKTYLSLDLSRTVEDGFAVDFDAVRGYVLGEDGGEEELAGAIAEDSGALHRRLALGAYGEQGDFEEAKRLLYVAITRAKEAVIVSTLGKRTKDNPLGVPRNVLAGAFSGIDPLGSAIGEGTSMVDFGGSQPALVECVALNPEDVEGGESAAGGGAQRPAFMVPAVVDAPAVNRTTWKPLREGVFSYSSISGSSHEGDLLDRLADAYAASVDEAEAERVRAGGVPVDSAAARAGASARAGGAFGAGASLDEGGNWIADASDPFDEDRATDLGTAFHRLAQFSVASRAPGAPLATPPGDRVDALARACNLDGAQRARLDAALDHWFNCSLASEMSALPRLSAEVPFFVRVEDAFLEGEIDLLGFDEAGRHARVVDYKTGGSAAESPDDLRRKHVLQAACYAYAILLQGAESVEIAFVRVERPRPDGQPQCVRYRFGASDVPALRDAIAEVRAIS